MRVYGFKRLKNGEQRKTRVDYNAARITIRFWRITGIRFASNALRDVREHNIIIRDDVHLQREKVIFFFLPFYSVIKLFTLSFPAQNNNVLHFKTFILHKFWHLVVCPFSSFIFFSLRFTVILAIAIDSVCSWRCSRAFFFIVFQTIGYNCIRA